MNNVPGKDGSKELKGMGAPGTVPSAPMMIHCKCDV